MYLPCGHGHGVFVRSVAAPQALDEGRGWDPAPYHVLLALLLLDLQGESTTKDALVASHRVGCYIETNASQSIDHG